MAPRPPAWRTSASPLKERPGYVWVEEMFRRHRKPAPAAVATG